MTPPDRTTLRATIATGCRILGFEGLAEDVLGHISVRSDTNEVLVRCRGPRERGLRFTEIEDIRTIPLYGEPEPGDGYALPNELPLHLGVLRARSDVNAVVHAHPPAVIAAELAGLPFLPLIGAYNIPAARLAQQGIPIYPRSVLINSDALATQMVLQMAGQHVCILRGHGITAVGESVEQAIARALSVNSLAAMMCRVASLGGEIRSIPADDLSDLPDLGSGFNDLLLFRHHEERLRRAGLALST